MSDERKWLKKILSMFVMNFVLNLNNFSPILFSFWCQVLLLCSKNEDIFTKKNFQALWTEKYEHKLWFKFFCKVWKKKYIWCKCSYQFTCWVKVNLDHYTGVYLHHIKRTCICGACPFLHIKKVSTVR